MDRHDPLGRLKDAQGGRTRGSATAPFGTVCRDVPARGRLGRRLVGLP
jgi:hypothetical protein